MSAIFLSASVPTVGRGDYYKTADPFLIQIAVREFMVATLGRRHVVWGGHPAITPMVWAVCEDLGVEYARAVTLYQSKFFAEDFPRENRRFQNVKYIDAAPEGLAPSLLRMREAMLSESDFDAAVFIGGMEGIVQEYEMFVKKHRTATIVPVCAPGGATLQIAKNIRATSEVWQSLDFPRLFHETLRIDPTEKRVSSLI